MSCACNPEKNIKCMLHFDLDGYVIDRALNSPGEDDPTTHEIDCTCIFCIPGA